MLIEEHGGGGGECGVPIFEEGTGPSITTILSSSLT